MKNLTGKVALVTGGSRGIGAGIVRKLAEEGAAVAFTYLQAEAQAQALVAAVQLAGGRALALQADAAHANAMQGAIDAVLQQFGRLDILVNNAGIFLPGAIDDATVSADAMERQWQVNVLGVARTVRAVVPHLPAGGRIISIGSVAGSRSAFPGVGDYSATKAALAAYTRGWAHDLASKAITVNIVQPGLTDTDLKPADPAVVAALIKPVALGRWGTPREVGNVVAFLASEAASYVTGTTLNVDGGLSA